MYQLIRFSKAKRTQAKSLEGPGPGEYHFKSIFSEGPKFSFGTKNKKSQKFKTPGPGNYSPNLLGLKEKSPAWKIGKAEKIYRFTKNFDVPGPGSYLIQRKLNGKACTFPKAKREIGSDSNNFGDLSAKSTLAETS